LKAVHCWGVMTSVHLVFRNVIDCDSYIALPYFVTDRRFNLQLAAGLEAELDFVPNGAANPPTVRHPCDGSKPHSGRTAHNLKDAGHRIDPLHGVDVGGEICRHYLKVLDVQ
jgi:hypothetical protein